MSTSSSTVTMVRTIGVVLLIVGLVAVAVGVVYFVVPAHSLPSFLGRTHSMSDVHRSRRGIAGVVVGVLLLIAAAIALARSRAYED